MLKFYILRNVHLNKGMLGKIKFNFSIFTKLVPNSALIKAFQFAIFKHTLPRSHADSDLKPENPFKSYENDASYQQAI